MHEPTEDLPRVSRDAIESHEERLHDELTALYGQRVADRTVPRLLELLAAQPRIPGRRRLTQTDAIVIAYPDHLRSADGTSPLATLCRFACLRLDGLVSAVHLLPVHPYSSDDGYAVTDCDAVLEAHGSWEDVVAIGRRFRLMLDLVLNHVSAEHPWFRAFLRGDPGYRRRFLVPDPGADLTTVRRPRATPLLTRFDTADGPKDVWTTFSADQVDLNFGDPDVLLEAIRLLLTFVRRGAYMVRLDAVGFVWKQPGTESIHLPEAHAIVRILRQALDIVAPDVRLVAETNVPHAENVTYLGEGDGDREAQLVYNFALPPLLLHTLHCGDATVLSRWAADLHTPVPSAQFLNFTASHDGIGVTPVLDLLTDAQRAAIVRRVVAHGGLVSHRRLPDGRTAPYELNIAYADALTAPDAPAELRTDRLVVTQAIMMALKGVPALYLHTLLGSRSWLEGVASEGHPRAVNRRKLVVGGDGEDGLDVAELDDPSSERGMVHGRLAALLRARAGEPAFTPTAAQHVLDRGPSVFALERCSVDGEHRVLALHEVAGQPAEAELPPGRWDDLLDPGAAPAEARVRLGPYAVRWLRATP